MKKKGKKSEYFIKDIWIANSIWKDTQDCYVTEWVSEVAQRCPTLCYPMDCSIPGSSVHGIFQARVLEWVAISFSKKENALGKCK